MTEASRFNSGLRSSVTPEWETPPDLFARLDAEFGFTLDACASAANAKVAAYYTREQDALAQPWPGVVWCNPPYGRAIGRWVEKAYAAALAGSTVVALVPARTETAWWHRWVMRAAEVRVLRLRLRFSGAAINAPFPSAVVVFRPPVPGAAGGAPILTAMDARPGPMAL